MLQTNATHLAGGRHEELIAVIGAGTEQAVPLGDKVLEPADLFIGRGDLAGLVTDDVQMDAFALGVDVHAIEMGTAEQGAVDQIIQVHRLEGGDAVFKGLGVERDAVVPPPRQFDRRGEGDARRMIARRIKQGLFPLQVQHVGRHHHAPLAVVRLGQPLELDDDFRHALRHVDVEGVGVDGVTQPFDALARARDRDARD